MNAIGIALVWCIVQVTILAGVASVIYALALRHGPQARALTVFAGLILIVALTALAFSPWPNWQVRPNSYVIPSLRIEEKVPHSTAVALAKRSAESDAAPDDVVEEKAFAAATSAREPPAQAATFFEALLAEVQRAPAASDDAWGWPASVAIVFMVCVVVGLVRLVAGLAAVRSYRLGARTIADAALQKTADVLLAALCGPRTVVVCESERLTTPATIGWRRPLIILPAGWRSWSGEECRTVLAHEIAHIARHDFPTRVAAQVALVFHFYHPLVHWLAARLRLEQELAADAAAARLTGGPHAYLTTLAAMALRHGDRPPAWPARAFLPTRGTFLRRIEMLRDTTQLSREISARARLGMLALLLTAGLAVAGVRGPAADRESAADRPATSPIAGDEQPATTQNTTEATRSDSSGPSSSTGQSSSHLTTAAPGPAEPLSLAYVPRDAVAVAAFRPATLLNRPALAAVKKALAQQRALYLALGVAPERFEQVTIMGLAEQGPPGEDPSHLETAGFVLLLATSGDASAVLKALQPNPQEQEYAGQSYIRGKDGLGQFCFRADERTLVVSAREDFLRRLIVAGKKGASSAKWTRAWREGENADAAAVVNVSEVRDLLNQIGRNTPQGEIGLGSYSPLWQSTTSAVLSASFDTRLKVSLGLETSSGNAAQQVRDKLAAALGIGQKKLSQLRGEFSRLPGGEGAVMLRAVDAIDSVLDSMRIEQKRDNRVQATGIVDIDDVGELFAVLLPAIVKVREATPRMDSLGNIGLLALAMHGYRDVNGAFPPAILYGPDGKTPYSWRVALLPYLNLVPLYEQYKKEEPWDSSNNKQVLAQMPSVFRDPTDPVNSTFSSYFAITGPSTAFFGKEGATYRDIPDGTANTLLLVEARRDIPWTKPEDVPFDGTTPGTRAMASMAKSMTAGVRGAAALSGSKAKQAPAVSPAAAVGAPGAAEAPLPRFGGHYTGIFLAAFCDGSVRIIPQDFDPVMLRRFIIRDGGEPHDTSHLEDPRVKLRPR